MTLLHSWPESNLARVFQFQTDRRNVKGTGAYGSFVPIRIKRIIKEGSQRCIDSTLGVLFFFITRRNLKLCHIKYKVKKQRC